MKISREDVLRVAQLAHLELEPEEVETYRSQLDEILSYVGKLQELDVSGVAPMTQFRASTTGTPGQAPGASAGAGSSTASDAEPELRDDVVRPCTVAEAVLAQAPDAAKPFFRVPKVIER
ncbi:MAG: Asp-tRNA(Asn)/Glu-tRNA(Gln) amidotransferase subunit GatC [Candidatus Acidiferrales bacterium]